MGLQPRLQPRARMRLQGCSLHPAARTEEEGHVEQRLGEHHVGVVDEGAAAREAIREEDVVEVRVAVHEGERVRCDHQLVQQVVPSKS